VGGRRLVAVLAAAAIAATGVGVGAYELFRTVSTPPPACTIGSGPQQLVLTLDQGENASTIAAVAKQLQLPDHAVTVALATALQESKLHNYPFGDRDSVGLFQQRPSQGWGTPTQLLTPAYAAGAFFRHLADIPGWQSLPVAAAAQEVQHSADGSAYAQWEEEARAMARVLTGESEPGMACRFPTPHGSRPAALQTLANRELGANVLGRVDGTEAQDWTVAQWLVGHADSYGIVEVNVRGQQWTNDGKWRSDSDAAGPPSYRFASRGS
jgi:hypothetical protein